MSSPEPPAYGTPERRESPSPGGATRYFEARHQPREAIALVVVGGMGVVVVGTGVVVLLAEFVLTGSDPGRGSFPTESGMSRAIPLVMLALFAAVGALLAGAVVSGLARAVRRSLILRIDADGVTLERRRWWGCERFIPWSAVRGLSAYTAIQRTDDSTSTAHWFQVDLLDGTIERRRLDRRRYSWIALAEVVRAVAPRTALMIEGELPSRGES